MRHRMIRIAIVVVAASVLANAAQADDQTIAKRTREGREVQIRGFAEFDADCRLRHVQTITIVDAPQHGRVETRPGEVTIGDNWVGARNCAGAKLDGVRVWYVPRPGFVGIDRFSFDVGYQSHRTVRAVAEIRVE